MISDSSSAFQFLRTSEVHIGLFIQIPLPLLSPSQRDPSAPFLPVPPPLPTPTSPTLGPSPECSGTIFSHLSSGVTKFSNTTTTHTTLSLSFYPLNPQTRLSEPPVLVITSAHQCGLPCPTTTRALFTHNSSKVFSRGRLYIKTLVKYVSST